ncbi:unnamed protein product [Arctogadus glacialis]
MGAPGSDTERGPDPSIVGALGPSEMSRLYSWGGQPHRDAGSARHGPAPLSAASKTSAAAPVPLAGPWSEEQGARERETCTNPMSGSFATLLVRDSPQQKPEPFPSVPRSLLPVWNSTHATTNLIGCI